MSTESLYGTNLLLFFPAPWSAKAEITRPRVLRDLEKGKRGGVKRGVKSGDREALQGQSVTEKNKKAKDHEPSKQSWPKKAKNI